MPHRKKIGSFEDLPNLRDRYSDQRVVYTAGCFDLLHPGHVQTLAERRELGDTLIVGVTSDERVRSRKGPDRPFIPEAGRLAMVSALQFVDHTFIMPLPTETQTPAEQVLLALQPNVFVDSAENKERWTKSADFMAALSIEIFFANRLTPHSTTAIIDQIRSSETTFSPGL